METSPISLRPKIYLSHWEKLRNLKSKLLKKQPQCLPDVVNMTLNNRTPVILCADPTAVSETFVRRHIHLLNNGAVTILGEVANPLNSEEILGKPYSSSLSSNTYRRRLLRFLYWRGVPKDILEYLWPYFSSQESLQDRTQYLLFEFGYIFVRNFDYAVFGRMPFFVYFRGQDASSLLRQPQYLEVLKRCLHSADGVVFVSKTLRNNLVAYGITVPSSIVIPSGVETALFCPDTKSLDTAVSIGRFVEKKAHSDTLRALRIITEKIPNFHLTIVGDGPLFDDITNLSIELGLTKNVTFAGALERPEIASLLSSARYYIQSSKVSRNGDSEGFPSAIQEALSSGCVVCSTDHAGAGDFLSHRQTALLCPEGDFQAMAENILLSESNSKLRRDLSRNSRKLAEAEFDADICVKRYEEFVRLSLAGK